MKLHNSAGNTCGRPIGSAFNMEEEKIIAGYDVGYYRYPWFVALMTSNIIACGGTLIGTKAVLTAAHCYKDYIVGHNKTVKLDEIYKVILGIYNKCEKEKTQKQFPVEKVYIHEKYKEAWPYYDIALLKLKESASSYEPICLPKAEGTVPGMGTIKYHGSTPCTLHEARILIYPDDECRKMINRTGNDPKKVFRAFCAGYMQGGIDTCQGDSGGPLQVVDEYGNYILLGIVSFGFHCANPGLLGMYTDVSQYVDWIEEKTGFSASIDASNVTAAPTTASNETASTVSTMVADQLHLIKVFLRKC
ncbi:trypsin-1-like [Asbolus verrucosus]|uniref:Trypsin-1-like n=1 Tax=Asbolus verrucosus TaxID=1661398 RepID=A0A482VKH6_ASBVE|nr:trypsin-1-like [Asbolus verrucosus]